MKTKTLKTLMITVVLTAVLTLSANALSSGGATVEASGLNLRSGASTGYSIITAAPRGAAVIILENAGNNWYKVNYRGSIGYMSGDYLKLTTSVDGTFGTGAINGSSVRFRSAPSLSASILGTYNTGTKMTVVGVSGDWYKVNYNGTVGYVYSQYLTVGGTSTGASTPAASTPAASTTVAAAPAAAANETSDAGQVIVDTAMKYLGVPYLWGGTSSSGFDCSGLVYYVYKECGYSINRTAASIYQNGTYVEKANLKVGDAVCFTTNSSASIGHVGIYIGNGQFIHSSSGSGKVITSDLSSSYYVTNYVGARRIV